MDSVTARAFRAAAMGVLVGVGGPANAGKLRVTQAAVPVTKTSVLADFTAQVASYSGYAEVSQTWGVAGTLNDGITRSPGLRSRFGITGGSVYQTLYNLYLTNTGGTLLVAAGSFLDPAVLGSPTAATWPVPQLVWGNQNPANGMGIDLLTTSHSDKLTLGLLTAALGLLDGAKVHLYQTEIAPTADTPLATFAASEADYSGYASQTVATWLASYVGDDQRARVSAASLLFQPNASTVPNEIFGVYVTNAASDTLLYAYLLDVPVDLSSADDGLIVDATLIYGT